MDKYNQFIIRLKALEQLEHDWDGDDAYPPSEEAVKQMRVVPEWLGLYFPPTKIQHPTMYILFLCVEANIFPQ